MKGESMGFLDKLIGKAKNLADKAIPTDNTDLMEGMVAAGTLVAYADGDCSDDEVQTIQNILGSSSQLAGFGNAPAQYFDKCCEKIEASKRMGKMDLMKEIKEVADAGNEEDSVRVLIMAIEVADADGTIDEDETKALESIAKTLDLKLADYL